MCQQYEAERGLVDLLAETYGHCPGCRGTIICWCDQKQDAAKVADRLRWDHGHERAIEVATAAQQHSRARSERAQIFWATVLIKLGVRLVPAAAAPARSKRGPSAEKKPEPKGSSAPETTGRRPLRNESTPEARRFWANVDAAAARVPEWLKRRLDERAAEIGDES